MFGNFNWAFSSTLVAPKLHTITTPAMCSLHSTLAGRLWLPAPWATMWTTWTRCRVGNSGLETPETSAPPHSRARTTTRPSGYRPRSPPPRPSSNRCPTPPKSPPHPLPPRPLAVSSRTLCPTAQPHRFQSPGRTSMWSWPCTRVVRECPRWTPNWTTPKSIWPCTGA